MVAKRCLEAASVYSDHFSVLRLRTQDLESAAQEVKMAIDGLIARIAEMLVHLKYADGNGEEQRRELHPSAADHLDTKMVLRSA